MKTEYSGTYLLDASALLAFLEDEPGAEVVQGLLEAAQKGRCKLLLSFISLLETCSQVWFQEGEEAARLLYGRLTHLPLQTVGIQNDIQWLASEILVTRPVTVTEAWLFATARHLQATLVHKDPDLKRIDPSVKLLSLPERP